MVQSWLLLQMNLFTESESIDLLHVDCKVVVTLSNLVADLEVINLGA
jgi:hypothetical protein